MSALVPVFDVSGAQCGWLAPDVVVLEAVFAVLRAFLKCCQLTPVF